MKKLFLFIVTLLTIFFYSNTYATLDLTASTWKNWETIMQYVANEDFVKTLTSRDKLSLEFLTNQIWEEVLPYIIWMTRDSLGQNNYYYQGSQITEAEVSEEINKIYIEWIKSVKNLLKNNTEALALIKQNFWTIINKTESINISWYFISSELEWWYWCWDYDNVINSLWNMSDYSNIYNSAYKFCDSKSLWILSVNNADLSQAKTDELTSTNPWEYILLASNDFIKNIQNSDLYNDFKAKNIKWFESQSDISLFFQNYLTYWAKNSINSKVKISWTYINPKWNAFYYDMDWNKIENNINLKIILIENLSIDNTKTLSQIKQEKFQKALEKAYKQVDKLVDNMNEKLISLEITHKDLESKVNIIIAKIKKAKLKQKNQDVIKLYDYAIEKLNTLINDSINIDEILN